MFLHEGENMPDAVPGVPLPVWGENAMKRW